MPIVATMTAIAVLRGGGASANPFFDPGVLRDKITTGLEGVDEEIYRAAMRIADDLDSKLNRFHAKVDTSIDAYIEESSNPRTDAADLIMRLAPLDNDRAEIMNAVIEARSRLVAILDVELWDDVFG